jgi:hypothetical protein
METLMNILLIILWNVMIPSLIGYLVTHFMKKEDRDNIALNYVIGLIAVFGIFEPITLVAIYLKFSLTLLTNIMMFIWIVLSLVSIIINYKRFLGIVKRAPQVFGSFNIFMAGALLLILIQGYVYMEYEHIDDDDAFFVATATTAVEKNNLYVNSAYSGGVYGGLPTRYILSPFSIYYAVMNKLTGIHATIYAHLYLPIIILVFVYMIYYIWGRALFHNSRSIGMFLFLIGILNIFGNYSEFTTQSFLLLRLWQGKAVLAAGIIPFLLYVCYKLLKEEKQGAMWVVLFLTSSAASLVSSMGIFLAPLAIGCWGLVNLIQTRKIKKTFFYMVCCLPCIICGIIYIIIS